MAEEPLLMAFRAEFRCGDVDGTGPAGLVHQHAAEVEQTSPTGRLGKTAPGKDLRTNLITLTANANSTMN